MARCGHCGAQRSLGAGERDRSLPLLAEIDHGHDRFPPILSSLPLPGPLLGCVLKTIVRDLRFDLCAVSLCISQGLGGHQWTAITGHSSVRIRGGRRFELARVTCTVRVLALVTRRPDPEALFHLTSDTRAANSYPSGEARGATPGRGRAGIP
jgi:hypothetical protein